MNSIIASLAAILGVVLGSVLTYLFQARNARQAQESARDQRLWQERLTAYSEFAGVVTDFRRSENDRWHREQEDPQGAPFFPSATSRISYAPQPRPLCAESSSSAAAPHSAS